MIRSNKQKLIDKVLVPSVLNDFRTTLFDFFKNENIQCRDLHKNSFFNKGILFNNQIPIGLNILPFNLPGWYNNFFWGNENHLDRLFKNKYRYIILFSKENAKWFVDRTEVEVFSNLHPLPLSDSKWSFEDYKRESRPGVIQVELFQRCIHGIHMLPDKGMRKILIHTSRNKTINALLKIEKEFLGNEFRAPMKKTVELIYEKEINVESWYQGNIFFLHLYDFSLDWVVLKCIADHVPLLVNHLPAMHEYLGKDYPLFYSNYEEASNKMLDMKLVYDTHIYLKNRSNLDIFNKNKYFLELSNFINPCI